MSDAIEAARRIDNSFPAQPNEDDARIVARALLSAVEGKGRETCDAGAPLRPSTAEASEAHKIALKYLRRSADQSSTGWTLAHEADLVFLTGERSNWGRQRAERIENEINRLEGDFGHGSFRDGLRRNAVDKLKRELTAITPALASPSTEGWRGMESAPVTEPMKHVRVMCWSLQLGVCVGDLHRWKDSPATINVACYHGDAVANWGVTHWQPLLAGPEQKGHADEHPEPKAST